MQLAAQIQPLLAQIENPPVPGIDLSLDRMRALLAALGDPERKLPPVIHVAGTNGKGSTIAFMRAMLEADGKRVHGYISPPLKRFNERITLAGQEISDEALLPLLQRVAAAVKQHPVTSFEAMTAVAFLAFAEHEADVLLLEVGMGGRLDATNVINRPIASVLTPIGLDHQEFLGPDLANIAAEKAGIMKSGVPCFSARQAPEVMNVLMAQANALNAPLHCVTEPASVPLGLSGEHQRWNAALAVLVLQAVMPVSDEAMRAGLANTRWPARLQRLTRGPLVEAWGEKGEVWLDGAHNTHAAQAMAGWANAQKQPVVMIAGLMARKDAQAFFAPLAGVVEAVACINMPQHADAQQAQILADAARAAGISDVAVAEDAAAAITQLKRYKAATVVVAGSLYLAGEILKTHE